LKGAANFTERNRGIKYNEEAKMESTTVGYSRTRDNNTGEDPTSLGYECQENIINQCKLVGLGFSFEILSFFLFLFSLIFEEMVLETFWFWKLNKPDARNILVINAQFIFLQNPKKVIFFKLQESLY
jgi:hypothetical protein